MQSISTPVSWLMASTREGWRAGNNERALLYDKQLCCKVRSGLKVLETLRVDPGWIFHGVAQQQIQELCAEGCG